MTNYVTGKLPVVVPKDWMKIAVGGVIGAIKLSDLKSYVGSNGGGNGGEGGNENTPDWTLRQVEKVLSSKDFYSKGFQFTSLKNGTYKSVEIKSIAGYALSDFEINYPTSGSTGNTVSLIPLQLNKEQNTIEVDVVVTSDEGEKVLTYSLRPDYVITPENSSVSTADLVNGQDFVFTVGGLNTQNPVTWEIEGADPALFNTVTENNGSDFRISLKDSNSIDKYTTIKVKVKQANGNVLQETSLEILAVKQVDWIWVPDNVTVSKQDFIDTGVETFARYEGSGINVNLRTPEGYSYGDFTIEQNIGANGQAKFKLFRQGVLDAGAVVKFVGTDDSGVSKEYTVTVTA